jgi:hypothetical protein
MIEDFLELGDSRCALTFRQVRCPSLVNRIEREIGNALPASLVAGTFPLPVGSADAGTSVTVSFKDNSGGDESKTMPAAADGSVTITFDVETERGGRGATISYTKNGQKISSAVQIPKSSSDGFNQYEPFKVPEFFAVNPVRPLSDNIDLVAFLNSATDFSVGDFVQVTKRRDQFNHLQRLYRDSRSVRNYGGQSPDPGAEFLATHWLWFPRFGRHPAQAITHAKLGNGVLWPNNERRPRGEE